EKKAASLADSLYRQFLASGSFTFSREPRRDSGFSPASGHADDPNLIGKIGFAGLDVHSVAFELGSEEPKVHVYVTNGSDRALNRVAREVEGVRVELHNIGNPTIKRDLSRNATNRGHFYVHEHGGARRVACGSSCAPINERYTGTFDALVRKARSDALY